MVTSSQGRDMLEVLHQAQSLLLKISGNDKMWICNVLFFLICVDEETAGSKSSADHVFRKVASNPRGSRTSDHVDPRILDLIHSRALGDLLKSALSRVPE